ncbi:hypothetical protein ACF068_01675 [Streptomyces sp. NPDC016309]|uniref:hypothetical protein n=1 Tax=Streptomyces sp. NPDC016309 TaxID=3364965 RepID=UPI0036F84D38
MTTVLNAFVPVALFVLLALPSLVGHARERAVDRQLRGPRRPADTRRRGPSPGPAATLGARPV